MICKTLHSQLVRFSPTLAVATKVKLGTAHCRLLYEALLGVNTVARFGLLRAD